MQLKAKYIKIADNTKPSARVGRKAQGSHVDSRDAEIPFMDLATGFLIIPLDIIA